MHVNERRQSAVIRDCENGEKQVEHIGTKMLKVKMRSAFQGSPFNYYSTKQRTFEAHYPKATASGGGSLL